MGKFNSAKMLGASDVAFQNRYNELIDLLDTGLSFERTTDGKRLRVVLNNQEGLSFYEGATRRGGLSIINNKLALVSDVIANASNLLQFIDYDVIEDDIYGMQFWSPYNGVSEKVMSIYGYATETNNIAHIGAVGGTKRSTLSLFASAGLTPSPSNGSYISLDGNTANPFIQMYSIGGASSGLLNIFKDRFEVVIDLEERFKVTSTGATILGNTVWHEGNDGSGSGLDADTVDGIKGADIAQSRLYESVFASGMDAYIDPYQIASAGLWELTVIGNPNALGSAEYRAIWYGYITVNIGWSGSAVTRYIHTDVISAKTPLNINALSVDVFLSDYSTYNGYSRAVSLGVDYFSIKVSGFNSASSLAQRFCYCFLRKLI